MNASTIATYINSLTKDIYKLKIEINTVRLENAELRETIAKLRSQVDWDAESVASNDFDFDVTSESSEESEPDVTSDSSEESEPDVTSESSEESEPDVTSDHEYASHVNYELSHLFYQLAEKQDNEFKKKAYTRAARMIKDFPVELTHSSQITHVNGIGKGIANLIDEYMDTGTFKKLCA